MGIFELFANFRKKSPTVGETTGLQCCLCSLPLSDKIIQDAWNHRAHAHHALSFCSSCDRILSPTTSAGAFRYSDGRFICGLCKKSSVTDGIRANRGRRRVQALLEAKGFQGIPKNVEIVLSHARTLSGHSRQSHTAGLTLSHYHFNDYKRVGMTHQIGILSGLPLVEFEAVLAHELLHVWQQENDVRFTPMYAEGLCELGAYLIYSEDNSELGRHLLAKMRERKDPVYGAGFRLMQKKLEQQGWAGLIAEVLANKRGLENSVLRKIFGSK